MSAQCRTLTCIRCPRGCQVEVEAVGTEVVGVRGNSCKRGEAYARAEIAAPVRTVTSTVPVIGSATERMVSVKTSREVPRTRSWRSWQRSCAPVCTRRCASAM